MGCNGAPAFLVQKKYRTPRCMVAQRQHYLGWIRVLLLHQIYEVAPCHREGVYLEVSYGKLYCDAPPGTTSTRRRICLLAADIDLVLEILARHLCDEYSATINVLLFKHFTEAYGNQFTGHWRPIDPAETEDRGDGFGPKRRSALTPK